MKHKYIQQKSCTICNYVFNLIEVKPKIYYCDPCFTYLKYSIKQEQLKRSRLKYNQLINNEFSLR